MSLVLVSSVIAEEMSLTLTPSNYHGYNLSCFGSKDGAIDLTVTGGAAPYTYKWSTNATTQDISNLAAGYYHVEVTSNSGEIQEAEITLDEPSKLQADIDVYQYGNGYSISCFSCSNGNAEVAVTGGASPYAYDWSDGPTTSSRSNLGPTSYTLEVTDANGCIYKPPTIYLQQPDRSDWTMAGNAGTNPATQYFGTSDNKDVVFKSNGAERLRLLSNGQVKIGGLGTTSDDGYLGVTAAGILTFHPNNPSGIAGPYWSTTGNWINGNAQWLGTHDHEDLVVKTNNLERMRLMADGRLGVGTSSPSCDLQVHHAGADAKLLVSSTSGSSSIWTSNDLYGYAMSIDANGQGHIVGSGNAEPIMTFAMSGKVGIGATDLEEGDYNLYVTEGILTEKVRVELQADWPDYVFRPNYTLMSLEEIHAYILQNGHLPGVASADQVGKEGMDVAQNDAMLLKKIEELTLLMIQLNDRVKALEAENKTLRSGR